LSVIDNEAAPRIQSRRRRGARRAAKAGLEVSESDDFGAFWPILEQRLQSVHRVQLVHTADEVDIVKKRFADAIRLVLCGGGAAAMGGGLILKRNGSRTCNIPRPATMVWRRELSTCCCSI
jgi:hypothetical protein